MVHAGSCDYLLSQVVIADEALLYAGGEEGDGIARSASPGCGVDERSRGACATWLTRRLDIGFV
jgi:hypothetical protein